MPLVPIKLSHSNFRHPYLFASPNTTNIQVELTTNKPASWTGAWQVQTTIEEAFLNVTNNGSQANDGPDWVDALLVELPTFV